MKKFFISIIIIIILISICTYSFAATGGNVTMSKNAVDNYMGGTTQGLSTDSSNSTLIKIANTFYRFIQVLGVGYVVILYTVLGIRYFIVSSSHGSPDEIRAVRGRLWNHTLVSVIILGAEGIFDIIYNAFV